MNNRLFYRRQFLMANGSIDELQHWQHHKIGDIHLYAHPDLEVTSKEGPVAYILMIGYIFDPDKPTKTNEEIITDVTLKIRSFKDLINTVKLYTGRYTILYKDNDSFLILHDALGLREIYYCTQQNKVICGSQPNLLEYFSEPNLKLSTDPDLLEFIQNHFPKVRNGRLWPGDGTAYENVKHLLPNHYLDLIRLKTSRYWPNSSLNRIELDEAVFKCARFLEGAMKAVAHRYSLMMAVTAGLDSRTLLAASKELRKNIYFFINKKDPLNDHSGDIRIPKEIFRRLNIPFHVHEVPNEVPHEFKQIFLKNTYYSREILLPAIYNIYFKEHSEKVNILGVGEVGRTKFFDPPKNLKPYYLAYMLRYRKSKFAVKECALWLENAKTVVRAYDLNIMTLFWWEVLIGNWGAVGNSESDIAIEEFDPYNSHFLYETFLSVDAKYRTFRDNILFIELIKSMWPELLDIPDNPPEGAKDWLLLALHKIGMELPLRMLKYKLHLFFYNTFWNK